MEAFQYPTRLGRCHTMAAAPFYALGGEAETREINFALVGRAGSSRPTNAALFFQN